MLVQTSPEDFLRSVDAAKAERRRQRDLDRADDDRKLDPWERYRVLTDHVESLHDRSEQVDRKTRFALLILGGVNAINLAVVLRGGEYGLPAGHGALVTTYAASYVLLSLGLFCDAIAALRPRHAAPGTTPAQAPGLKSPDAVIGVTLDEYCERWTGARLSAVNVELASMAYATALENAIKLRALRRVYWGLYVLVGLTAAFLAALAVMGARANG
jgi:hypothetical protein